MKHGIMICGAKSSPNNNKTEVTKPATYWKLSNTKKKNNNNNRKTESRMNKTEI